jgi:hypothetical protein
MKEDIAAGIVGVDEAKAALADGFDGAFFHRVSPFDATLREGAQGVPGAAREGIA